MLSPHTGRAKAWAADQNVKPHAQCCHHTPGEPRRGPQIKMSSHMLNAVTTHRESQGVGRRSKCQATCSMLSPHTGRAKAWAADQNVKPHAQCCHHTPGEP